MSSLAFQGPMHHRIASFLTLNRYVLQVAVRHALGQKMAPDWDVLTEVGIRFVRHQFTFAMRHKDIEVGRARFNSLLTKSPDFYDVATHDACDGSVKWFVPAKCESDGVLFYCHGGGYTFRGPVTFRFAEMLAHHTRTRVCMPLYRLTPEHAHPAQADDALAAWQALAKDVAPDQIVVIGDSAGGHMALTLLQSLKQEGLPQPALCIGICPWTDIGDRGASLTANDATDLVQGWMALQFGLWLDPHHKFGRDALSPIAQNYAGLAPIYLIAGGREVLRDMVADFAEVQAKNGADILFDLWADMPHNFLAYDSLKTSSTHALRRIAEMIAAATTSNPWPDAMSNVTRTATGRFQKDAAEGRSMSTFGAVQQFE